MELNLIEWFRSGCFQLLSQNDKYFFHTTENPLNICKAVLSLSGDLNVEDTE